MLTNSPVTVTFWPLPLTPVITNQANPMMRTCIDPPVQLVVPSVFSMIGISTSCLEVLFRMVAVPFAPIVTIWSADWKLGMRSVMPWEVGPGTEPDWRPSVSPTESGQAILVPLIIWR